MTTTACDNSGNKLKRYRAARGFTLIEVMVVLVIVAIIMGLAMPAYTGYMQKTRRTDAKVTLTSMASQQERYFLKNNAYAGSTTALGYGSNPHISDEGYYSVVVVNNENANGGACTAGSCYTITATAISGQADDSDCATFKLSDTGRKVALKEGGADNSADCW